MTPGGETLKSVVKTIFAVAALDLNENNGNFDDAMILLDLARMRGEADKVRRDTVVCLYRSAALFTVLLMFVQD